VDVVAIGAALGLAFVLGISSAPNAASALVASRAAPWRVALGYSFLLHALGALLGGTAVALTIAHLVTAPDDEIATIYAAGCIATIAFVGAASRLGLPTSATHGLVGGVAGAGLAEGGVDAVNWGGFDGFRPVGVLGTLAALVVAPVIGQGPAAGTPAKTKTWAPHRTPDGHPDFQGVWTHGTLTPFERPPALGTKAFYTEEEALETARQAVARRAGPRTASPGDVGGDNEAFVDTG